MQPPDVVLGMLVDTPSMGKVSPCHTCIHNLAGKCAAGEGGVFHFTMLNADADHRLITKVLGVAVIRKKDGSMRLSHVEFSGGTHFVYMAQGRVPDLPLELHSHCPEIRRGLVTYVTLFVSNI